MAFARGFAATAIFAGLALGLAAPASALSGHYINTETNPQTGQSSTSDWYITPCGDGCASVAVNNPGDPGWQARLVNGQWTMDTTSTAICVDGTQVANAESGHYTWDANALAGRHQVTINVPACGNPAGVQFTNNFQLKQAP